MPAIQVNVATPISVPSLHPFHPEASETEPHCSACAMVDELIAELIRKKLREATRG